jgi:hypothetical protein
MKKPNPAYGLPNSLRQQVLSAAEQLGVRVAAGLFKVSLASIYNWRKWDVSDSN